MPSNDFSIGYGKMKRKSDSFLLNRLTDLDILTFPIKIFHFLANLWKSGPDVRKLPWQLIVLRNSLFEVPREKKISQTGLSSEQAIMTSSHLFNQKLDEKCSHRVTEVPRNLFPCYTRRQLCLETKNCELPTGIEKQKRNEILSF